MTGRREGEGEEAAFQRLFQSEESVGLAVLGTDGRIRFANQALQRLCGAGPPPAAGELAAPLFSEDTRGAVAGAIATALGGQAAPTVAARLADANLPPDAAVEVFCRPLRGEPGALLRVADVTARRRIEAQLEQGARLQSVGQLAGGLAHDFNNLLAAISGAAEASLARQPDPATTEDLRQILDSAARGARLVRQLLAFASQQSLAPRVVALRQAVQQIAPLLQRLLGRRHPIELSLADPGPRVRVDPTQLDQVLLNLVVNARDAMPNGGTIRVSLAAVRLTEETPVQGSIVPPGDWAVLAVEDQGRGIPPEMLSRIFEPFYTTRRGEGGTGLGLSTVLGVLRQSGGHVGVASRPGYGTVFHLWFPAVQEEVEQAAAPRTEVTGPAGVRRVLLVEDETPLRRLAVRALTAAGHEVREAEDAEDALAILEEGYVPEVMVSDVTMPGEMDGLALGEAVKAKYPEMTIVLVSGYAQRAVGVNLAARGFRFLGKPFRMAELVAAVGEGWEPPE